ncbi:hypothetical protein MKC74_06720 [[Clostridium] innocuum]|nr:hypothetical protein [[Clostridium] innocuum]
MDNGKLDINSRLIWIYIREKTTYDLAGIFFNPYMKEPIPFYTIADLIVKIEEVMDGIEKMKESGITSSITELMNNYKKMAVDWNPEYFFVIEILYKQHNSWQGRIKGSSLEDSVCFKSVMELILILFDAVKIDNRVDCNIWLK